MHILLHWYDPQQLDCSTADTTPNNKVINNVVVSRMTSLICRHHANNKIIKNIMVSRIPSLICMQHDTHCAQMIREASLSN